MSERRRSWRDEEGVLHTVEYVDEDPVERLPNALVDALATHLLDEPIEDPSEWLALDGFLEREIDASTLADASIVAGSSEGEESSVLVDQLRLALTGLDNEDRILLLDAVRTLLQTWVDLVGDVEKLAGHLLVTHLERVDVPVKHGLLIARHYALHKATGGWGHDGDLV